MPSWLAGVFLLGPAVGLASVVAGVIVSARVNDAARGPADRRRDHRPDRRHRPHPGDRHAPRRGRPATPSWPSSCWSCRSRTARRGPAVRPRGDPHPLALTPASRAPPRQRSAPEPGSPWACIAPSVDPSFRPVLAYPRRPMAGYHSPMSVRATPFEWALFLALGFMWGSSYLFIKLAVDRFGTFTLITLRLLIGAAFLWIVVRAVEDALAARTPGLRLPGGHGGHQHRPSRSRSSPGPSSRSTARWPRSSTRPCRCSSSSSPRCSCPTSPSGSTASSAWPSASSGSCSSSRRVSSPPTATRSASWPCSARRWPTRSATSTPGATCVGLPPIIPAVFQVTFALLIVGDPRDRPRATVGDGDPGRRGLVLGHLAGHPRLGHGLPRLLPAAGPVGRDADVPRGLSAAGHRHRPRLPRPAGADRPEPPGRDRPGHRRRRHRQRALGPACGCSRRPRPPRRPRRPTASSNAPTTIASDAPMRRTESPRSTASPSRSDPQAAAMHRGRLAQRGDPGQRGDAQGEQDEQVRPEGQPATDGRPPDLLRAADEDAAAGDEPDPDDEDDRRRDPQDGRVGQRVDDPGPHPIDGAVRGDGHAGRQGEPDGRVEPAVAPEHLPRALEQQEPDEQESDPDGPRHAQALAEQDDPDRDGQERRGASGDRVDDGQVAAPVGRGQQDEVARLDDARDDARGRSPPAPAWAPRTTTRPRTRWAR